MKRLILISIFFLSLNVNAQNDSLQYVQGLPMTGEDSVPDEKPNADFAPQDRLKPVAPGKLPTALTKALRENEAYKGWEQSSIYIDKNTGLYIVNIPTNMTIRTFGFDKRGNPVTVNEATKNDLD